MSSEVSHYIVTAHPPGAVQCVAKGRFIPTANGEEQVAISKSRRLEFRSCTDGETPFPLLFSLTINGRITNMEPIVIMGQSLLFVMTHDFQYAVLGTPMQLPIAKMESISASSLQTICSGKVRPTLLGKPVDTAPILALTEHCLAMHLYDGFLTILPINRSFQIPPAVLPGKSDHESTTKSSARRNLPPLLGEPFHLRLEEHNILDLAFLFGTQHLAILHQDSYGMQHVVAYKLDNRNRNLSLLWKKQRIDGGSSTLIALPPSASVAASSLPPGDEATTAQVGYLLVLGHRQITLLGQTTQVVPMPACLMLAYCSLPPSPLGFARYLLGDEFGNVHMLTVGPPDVLSLDTLGSTNVLLSAMVYMDPGWVFCGSKLGDSQLLQIHPEPSNDSYLSILEEYINLGPIVDMDVCQHSSPGVITASGTSISGSLRLVRNGVGMKEFAAVELPGIQNMWAVRAAWGEKHDSFLVQSFVAETRILGVVSSGMNDQDEHDGDATLDEVTLEGLDSSSPSLFVCNIERGDLVLQVTETEIRVMQAASNFVCIHVWTPEDKTTIAVAAANESGQIVVALRGGRLVYLEVIDSGSLKVIGKSQMTSEVSCLNLNPFASHFSMETESRASAEPSLIVTVGLWDDFTVRVLTLDEEFAEVLQIHLSTEDEFESTDTDRPISSPVHRNRNNMMARSLCLVTLDAASVNASDGGVDMLFVGLGDGTLISFAIDQSRGRVSVRSKKEVSLGSQCINLIPLQTERGGNCVLATGDRPTVIYLAGGGTHNLTPKLCYSNVNLSINDDNEQSPMIASESIAVNNATPFVSPHLFDDSTLSSKHYSLCVSDDSVLRLGVIDDIKKLHVTTCRLGMAPRRVVHCPEGRLLAVGCIESGIQQLGIMRDELSMGNCIRFLDDTTFDDIERIDLEPYEMVLSMANVKLALSIETPSEASCGTDPTANSQTKAFLLVGTAYALPDEDEPTRGRIIVFSCDDEDSTAVRSIKTVTEMEVHGGVYSICQFYNGLALLSVNSKTHVCQLTRDGGVKLRFLGVGHHGHILSLLVQSRAPKHVHVSKDDIVMSDVSLNSKKGQQPETKEQLAIVGDLMRSISLVQYYPEHNALEEIARDFNGNWTTAIEMLTDDFYLGAENWSNIYVLRRNAKSSSEEVRCRLETVGRFHLGEMCNKFVSGSLSMPYAQSNAGAASSASIRRKLPASPIKGSTKERTAACRVRRPVVTIGSQTLFGTVDGTLGSIFGLDARTAAFFLTLERAMAKKITPVGDFLHQEFRAFDAENRVHPAHGFIDGDLIASFLDLDRNSMQSVVDAMNLDGGWEIEDHHRKKDEDEDMGRESQGTLQVDDVLAMVEEMTMFH